MRSKTQLRLMRPSSQARHWVLQSWCHNSAALHTQPNPTPSLFSALSEPEWPQQANSCVTACQSKHVCSDVRTCGGGVIYFDVKANVATSHLQKMLSFKIILYG